MGLLSLFQRQADPAATSAADASAAEPDAVAAARIRARRRLIGAAVLLGIGVVGFPLLFETQPRPVPVNIPIEIPRKDGAPPLAPPGPSPVLSAASAAVVVPDAEVPAAPQVAEKPADKPAERPPQKPAEIVERAADSGRELAPPPAPAQREPATAATAAAPAAKPAAEPSRPAAVPSRPATPAAPSMARGDGARAEALLNGQNAAPAASAAAGRTVVQVGAYTEPAKLKDARQKVESLGFKTYTQVVEVDGAKRTRVRVGPFATKAEADKAAARIKASGLPAAILTL